MLPLVLTTDVLRKPQETDLIERLEYAVRDATAHADTSQPVGRANAAAKGSGSRRTYKFFIPVRKFTPQRILTCASRKAILLDKNLSAVVRISVLWHLKPMLTDTKSFGDQEGITQLSNIHSKSTKRLAPRSALAKSSVRQNTLRSKTTLLQRLPSS